MKRENNDQTTAVEKRLTIELSRQGFQYYNSEKDKWTSFFPNLMPKVKERMIKVRLKENPGTILTLPFPLTVTPTMAYMLGLCLGNALWSKQFIIRVQHRQLALIESFSRSLNISFNVSHHDRGRKTYKKARHRRYFREYIITFPLILCKLFNAIMGSRKTFYRTPRIPEYLPITLQEKILSGYFNSKRVFVMFKNNRIFQGKCTITVRAMKVRNQHDPAQNFLRQIQDFLSYNDIKSSLTKYELNASGIVTCRLHLYASAVLRFQQAFRVQQAKFLALQALNAYKLKYPILQRILHHHDCSELELILLGFACYLKMKHGLDEFAYSRFEDVLDYSSSAIRQALYRLQDKGFIVGFMDDRHKEFYRLSDRFLTLAMVLVNSRHRNKSLNENGSSRHAFDFQCQNCFHVVDYLTALTDAKNFECPSCHGKELIPLNVVPVKVIS
ncbi:MAG: zinc ribbon domain-containing protein [Candidatus Helarchaeota archaeon]